MSVTYSFGLEFGAQLPVRENSHLTLLKMQDVWLQNKE